MKNKKSIFIKIFGGYFLISLLLLFSSFILSFNLNKSFYIHNLTSQLENIGIGISGQVIGLVTANNNQELNELVNALGREIETRITVIDKDGVVLADSEYNSGLMENHNDRSEIIMAKKNGFGKTIRFSETVQKNMLYVALPLINNKQSIGILRLSLFLSEINILINQLRDNIVKGLIVALLLSLLFAYFISRGIYNPLKKINMAAKDVASGNLKAKVLLKSKDELGELSENFNYMTERMESLFKELSYRKEELDRIITFTPVGLLVLDVQGRILYSNDKVEHICGMSEVKGSYFWELLRSNRLTELVEKLRKDKSNFTEEINVGARILLCSGSYISVKNEVVLSLSDITKIKNLELIKKDFVVNVSHELRTPLTAIKGFTETLLEMQTKDKNKHYLEIIANHTDRLISIVNDLLVLSQLENKDDILEKEDIDLRLLFGDIIKIFSKKINDKNLEYNIKLNGSDFTINADKFKIEQLFINLLDNAIKYTNKGSIVVDIESLKDSLDVKIIDSGIGIPQENLERIFERFYVVNKSRSRKVGGTGLGLSIVKHIVNLHNGVIAVESSPDKGSVFKITLPKRV